MASPWDRRSSAEQERVRELQLSSWLPQATSYAQHWADVSRRVGLEAGAADDLRDLQRFPSCRELDLLGAGGVGAPALLMRPTDRQVKALAETSTLRSIAGAIQREGETGRRRVLLEEFKPIHVHRAGASRELAIAYSRSDLDRLHRTGARAAKVLGLDDADYLVNALPSGPTLAWWGTYHLALGSSLLALHPRGHGDGLDAVSAAFALMPVTAVSVATEEAVELAAVLLEDEVALERVATLVVVGPPPGSDERAEIAEAWRAAGADADLRVRALWAPDAARALWAECADPTAGLHTYPDLELLEVLDPISGAPASGDGDLAITSLGWHGTALLRYQTGVWVDPIATDPCPGCGRTVPRLVGELVPDAWQPTLADGETVRTVDLRGVGQVLDRAGLAAWRIELRPPAGGKTADQLAIEIGGDLDDGRADAIYRDVTAAGGLAPHRIEIVSDPARVTAAVEAAGSVFDDQR